MNGNKTSTERLAQEQETGRIIETHNSHSKFVLKSGEDPASVSKYWLQHLNYVLQFKATDQRRDSQTDPTNVLRAPYLGRTTD